MLCTDFLYFSKENGFDKYSVDSSGLTYEDHYSTSLLSEYSGTDTENNLNSEIFVLYGLSEILLLML